MIKQMTTKALYQTAVKLVMLMLQLLLDNNPDITCISQMSCS
jgi:hypothetical protein